MRKSRTKRMFSEPSRGCRIAAGLRLRSGVPALLEDYHRNALLKLPASRTENRAEGCGYAPIVAAHPTKVFRMISQFEYTHRLSLDRANLHFFGMVHKCPCDCL